MSVERKRKRERERGGKGKIEGWKNGSRGPLRGEEGETKEVIDLSPVCVSTLLGNSIYFDDARCHPTFPRFLLPTAWRGPSNCVLYLSFRSCARATTMERTLICQDDVRMWHLDVCSIVTLIAEWREYWCTSLTRYFRFVSCEKKLGKKSFREFSISGLSRDLISVWEFVITRWIIFRGACIHILCITFHVVKRIKSNYPVHPPDERWIYTNSQPLTYSKMRMGNQSNSFLPIN